MGCALGFNRLGRDTMHGSAIGIPFFPPRKASGSVNGQ